MGPGCGQRAPEQPPGKGARFAVRLETGAAAPVPTELTPEELERLKSLGYVH